MAKEGDLVKLKYDKGTAEGVLMPSSKEGVVVIKLDNGYNIGIEKKKVESMTVIQKYSAKETPAKPIAQKKGLPKISILHTGGTIASKVDYNTGGVIARFTPEEILAMFPELRDIANVESRLIRNMWSDDMRFAHYNLMAKEVEKEIKNGAEGVIITHGTDTLHYTSAALAFILQDLPIPVILVGAQRSSDRGSSDAATNLIAAARFITKTDFAEVALCMHKTESDDSFFILPATKTRKMHTSRRDTFRPINQLPWAIIEGEKIIIIRKNYRKKSNSKLKIMPIKENLKIAFLKMHPNMFAEEFECYKNFDGLVLEGTGLGHAPISEIDEFTKEHTKIRKAISELAKKMPVVVSPQTIYGRIQINVYSPGRELQEMGVLGNYSDMTPETTFIKLAWLLSNYPKQVKEMIVKNIVGEISERTEPEGFLL